jgi:ABC-type uncharacterized transport system substrate-binding protein
MAMRCFWITFLVVAAGLLLSAGHARAESPRLFIVHSYEATHVCGLPQSIGVLNALAEAGLGPEKVAVRQFYMDTKRTHTTPQAMGAQAALALEAIEDFDPQVVVTLDDNAFRLVGLALVDRPGLSVVFSGLNGQPEDYHARTPFMESREAPGHNVTGVYEKLHLRRAVSVITRTVPGVRKVVGITDHSPTGEALTRQFAIESAQGLAADWTLERVRTFEEYKALIRRLNQDDSVQAIYPVALTLPDGEGGRVTAPGIFRWTIRHSTKPEIPLNYFFCKLGLFGGASVDFESMGYEAGRKAVAVLRGEDAGSLPVTEASEYAIVFNVARAKALGLAIPEEILLASDAVFKEMDLLR